MHPYLASFQNDIHKGIKEFSASLVGQPEELYQPMEYMLSLGGKRMRPLLVLLGNDLFGGKTERAMDAALAVEVFHNFTLIHDDIMDNAPLRRNQETVCKKWNPNIAILAGDTMMVKAYQLLSGYESPLLNELLNIFNKTAIEVCEGQQLDMNYETKHAGIEDYLKMIELKTGVLLAASLKMGALVAGAGPGDADQLYGFGKNIGIAFQLQDDILDAFGNPEKFGKQPGGDIISNKKTFLYLKALEKAKPAMASELVGLFSSHPTDNKGKILKVMEIFQQLNIKEESKAVMDKFFSIGKQQLEMVKADPQKKELLLKFAESLMEREI